MSFTKDYHNQHLQLLKRYWWKEIINPANVYRTWLHRYQRAERGYSDRDVWSAGDHLLDVTSGLLKGLAQEKAYLKWEDYFKANYKSDVYEDFEEVIEDIDAYREFDSAGWADGLGFELKHGTKETEDGNFELVSLNTYRENRLIKRAIKEAGREYKRRYAKMKRAMNFVAANIPSMWD